MNEMITKLREGLVTAGVQPADILVAAVSGGPDSMVMLDGLRTLKRKLVVVHVNHGLRKEANRDELVVRDYCLKHSLELVVCQLGLGKLKSKIEEIAREKRYEALAQVAQSNGCQWVVTAHTADDQVETVVANWLRGSLVKGLGGIKLRTGMVVRPMLSVTKKQVLAYAKLHKIKYAVDQSNADTKFTRNRIRHELLPELRKFNVKIDEQLLKNSQLWQQVDQALVVLAQYYLKQIGTTKKDQLVLSVSKLKELTPLMQVEVLKVVLDRNLTGIERSHFEEVMKMLASPKSRVAKRRLGGKLFASKAYDKITISQS
jgi:tRNA(Ile)-lysidine synthetase-like protein